MNERIDCRKVKSLTQFSDELLWLHALASIVAIMLSIAGILQLGSGLSLPSLDLSRPVFLNSQGETTSQAMPGQQLVVVLSIRNNIYNEDKPMVMIFEIRDGNGVTAHLAWQSTRVALDDTYNAGFSWIVPYDSAVGATYSARTFAISGFGGDALALANVFESNLSTI